MGDPIAENKYRGVDWKQDLRFCRGELSRHLEIGGSVLVAVERFAMGAALAFRKLLDHQILTNEVRDAQWPVRTFPCTKPPQPRWWFNGTVDLVNYHHFQRHYDVDKPTATRVVLQDLSNISFTASSSSSGPGPMTRCPTTRGSSSTRIGGRTWSGK